jgi:hypothetical protein
MSSRISFRQSISPISGTQNTLIVEQGTYVPVLTGFTGTTPTIDSATYTRIGRLVFINVYLSPTSGAAFGGTGGTTTISLPTNLLPIRNSTCTVSNANATSLGVGFTSGTTTDVMNPPTFSSTAIAKIFTTSYEI